MQGTLAEGTITSANLVDFSVLVAANPGRRVYVNVHTNDGVTPAHTGPGDFPGGEIRGQVRAVGPSID